MINKIIKFIKLEKFETNLVKSIQKDKYYILISCDHAKLEDECQNMSMQMKLL